MSDSPVIDAFPRRPLRLVRTKAQLRRRAMGLLLILLLTLPAFYIGYRDMQRAALRADLRERGVEARVLESDGSCLSRRQITGDRSLGCDLTISYQLRPEHGGKVLTAEVRLAEPYRVFAPPALYDPEAPGRVMLKPEVERAPDRVSGTIQWVLLLGVPALGLLFWIAIGPGGLRRAARHPRPVIVPIDRIIRGPGRIDVWFHRPSGGEPILNAFRHERLPFLVPPPREASSDQPWALALLAAKGDRPILLDSELADFDLTQDERARVRGAARPEN